MLVATAPLQIEKCSVEIVSEMRLPLVDRFYKECKYRVKCGRLDRVYTLNYEARIIAAARLISLPLQQNSDYLLLRNLCVLPFMRHQGAAKHLLKSIVTQLHPISCYCFALPHLQDFYLSLNFRVLYSHEVPVELGAIYERDAARGRGWILMGYCAL